MQAVWVCTECKCPCELTYDCGRVPCICPCYLPFGGIRDPKWVRKGE